MNKYALVALSAAGGFFSALAWSSWCSGLILLISFVPFFLIENRIYEDPHKYSRNACFIYLLPGFVIFSMMVMGWMRIASVTGAVCVIFGLAFLMTFTIWVAHIIRIRAGNIFGFVSLVTLWLSYELLSLSVNIVSPWMNLGNGLAKDLLFIQWYDVTGTAGGTLWVLCSNLFLSLWIVNYFAGSKRHRMILIIWISIILIPSGISVTRYLTIKPAGTEASEVLVIQPDTDPYTEKFVVPFEEQLKKALGMARNEASVKTAWIVTPETTVDDPVNLDSLNKDRYIIMIKGVADQFPGASIVSGLVSYKKYKDQKYPPTKSARKTDSSGSYYDHFNSAFRIDTGNIFEVYHKSKLVPGIEMQFANGPGRLISRILPYLGGTRWGYGMQEERKCFSHNSLNMKVAPVICYESVFGSFVTGYVKNGAEALFIITNDGWWKSTNGYKQHLYYASLRAIETRRPVVRAANTGISCIIDIRGRRTAETGWWIPATLKGDIIPEKRITAYVKYGNYLLKISAFASAVILLAVFVVSQVRKKRMIQK